MKTQAKADAELNVFLGYTGHLATITSQAENDFIVNNLGGAVALNNYWLGGYQPEGSPEPVGNWQWITGEAWNYTNWNRLEPTNYYGGVNSDGDHDGPAPIGSDEEVLQLGYSNGEWNDMERTAIERGYILEYDSGYTPGPIPEPTTMLLLGTGLLGIAGARRKMKK